MRLCVLEHFDNNNVIVKFHAALTLTAVSLVLPACRVVDIAEEEAYQRLCLKMAADFPS